MKSILELFAKDEIQVYSRNYHYNKDHLKKYEILEKLEKKISEKLDSEGKELFNKYCDINDDLHDFIKTNEFIYGYQLGALMMIDVYAILNSLSINDEKK